MKFRYWHWLKEKFQVSFELGIWAICPFQENISTFSLFSKLSARILCLVNILTNEHRKNVQDKPSR